MDKKTYSIGILSLTAVVLFVANFLATPPLVVADEVVKDRDYQAVTGKVQQGGEGLYITDNRTGQMAIFTYDPSSRTVKPRAVRYVAEAFAR